MTLSDELRQQLLELIYDLLTDDEAARLRERIEKEPEVATLFAELQRKSQVLAEASRLHEPRITLAKTPLTALGTSVFSPEVATDPAAQPRRSWLLSFTWAMPLAAALLIAVTLGGYARHRMQLSDLASDHLRLVVTGPPRLEAGAGTQFSIATSTATGSPESAQVQYALYASDGRQVFDGKERTDTDGRLTVAIPAAMSLGGDARFEVLAVRRDGLERMQSQLPVDRARYATQLSLDKPLYQPGETVYYRSLTLSRFGLQAPEMAQVHFEIKDPSGATVPGSEFDSPTSRGVGNGAFTVPEGQAGGEYTLVATSPAQLFPKEERKFYVRQYRLPRLKKDLELTRDSYTPGDTVVADFSATRSEGGPVANAALTVSATVDGQVVYNANPKATAGGTYQVEFKLPKTIDKGDGQLVVVVDDGGVRETIVKTIPINLGKVDVQFYPEGGDLVAGLDNRVYFMGRDPLDKPAHLEGQVLDSQGREVTRFVTTHKGLGSFKFTPQQGEQYSLKVLKPVGLKSQPQLPAVNAERDLVLSAGQGVFSSTGPISVEIRTEAKDRPLVVAAYCRGSQVGQQSLTTKAGVNEVEIPVVDEACGVLRLTVFDNSNGAQPARPVAERLVYRRPERKLNVQVADHSERYSPGEPVQVSLIVTNEKGEPAPATLGVAVVDDSLLKLADDDTPQMPTHFYLTTEVEKPEDLEKADFYLSSEPKAAESLDMLLGVQGWRRFVEKTVEELRREGRDDEQITRLVALGGVSPPPAVFDNKDQVEREYQAHLAAFEAEQKEKLAQLGKVAFWGGLGLSIGLAILMLARAAANVRVWVPTLGAAMACLLIGLVWMNGRPNATQVALTKFETEERSTALPTSTAAPTADALTPNEPLAEALDLKAAAAPAPAAPMAAAAPGGAPMDAAALRAAGNLAMQRGLGRADQFGAGMGGGAANRAFEGQAKDRFFFNDEANGAIAGRKRLIARREAELKQAAGGMADMRRAKRQADKEAGKFEHMQVVVREYAHHHMPGEPGVRTDFTETLYWHPLLIADADGRATIKFDLSDSVTTFRVLADAHANDPNGALGRIGVGSGEIISRIPFTLEPKLPLEVNAGDRIDLPVAVNNDTNGELPVNLKLVLDNPASGALLKLDGDAERQLKLGAEQRSREYFPLTVVGQSGKTWLEVRGVAGTLADAKRQSLIVAPPGFPVAQSYAGNLSGEQQVKVKLPADWSPGSLEVTLSAFPSTLSDLEKGIDGLLQEPTGCFEQASTSNYPNVLSLQYLEEHKVANPVVTRRAKDLLTRGYARLTGYECPQKGYEWFGGDPGHEALTAYGLMEFRDMAKVFDVDPAMIQRTADWLLARRDGKGSFARNPRTLDSFGGAPQPITDAYIVWALTEAKQSGIETELAHVMQLGADSNDPYLLALAAASAVNTKQEEVGELLLGKLDKLQAADGHLDAKESSITRSGGISLTVETTALAALAWLKSPKHQVQANKALEWITKNRQGGGFGSTQATILALKAMVAHAQSSRKTVAGGELVLKRNGQEIGKQPFGAGEQNTITLEGIAAKLEPGQNELTISLSGENEMPYALDVSYRALQPASHDDCPVRLTTKLAADTVKAGNTVSLAAELTNVTDKGQPMTIAIIGLPAGLQARIDQLEDLKKAKTIDYFEVRAREVICYWRSLAPSKQVSFQLDLVAEWPGKYTGPASRAYLYYTAEQKQWVSPLAIEVTKD